MRREARTGQGQSWTIEKGGRKGRERENPASHVIYVPVVDRRLKYEDYKMPAETNFLFVPLSFIQFTFLWFTTLTPPFLSFYSLPLVTQPHYTLFLTTYYISHTRHSISKLHNGINRQKHTIQ